MPLKLFALTFVFEVVLSALEEKHIIFNDPDFGSVDRLYLQYLPSNYEDQESFPLVLDFHGFTMTADEQRQYSRWDVLAEEEGFIAVFPEGVPDSPSDLRSWNINDDTGIYGDVCDRDRYTLGSRRRAEHLLSGQPGVCTSVIIPVNIVTPTPPARRG